MMRFAGKSAVVLGGAGGIGKDIVRRLSSEGARVIAVGRSPEGPVADGVGYMSCDITDPASVTDLAAACNRELGRVDVLVNSVGIAHVGQRIHECDIDQWDDIVAVNLRGAFLAMRAFIPAMLDGRGGSIVNIGSIASFRPLPLAGAYVVAKGGLLMLTRQAAAEYIGDGIRVNMVAPGPVLTPMLEQAGAEVIDQMKAYIPMGRLGTGDEIAAAVAYLASDEAAYTTGAIHSASGGLEAL